VASGEVSNLPLFRQLCATGLPFLVSSGMSSYAELDAAVAELQRARLPAAVMQCTSAYPCPPEQVGLNLMDDFRARYGLPVGLSDHSGTIWPGVSAAVMGASVLEVHVALSREMFGPNVPASVTSAELRQMVEGIRFIEAMNRAPVDKDAAAARLEPLRRLFTKSIVARVPVPQGTVLQRDHLALKKPGTGMPGARLDELLGRRLLRPLAADEFLTEDHLEPNQE
jgi:N-acetylneuraminate synthase